MSDFRLGTAQRQTLRESVVGKLRDGIVSGALEPGTHLAEIELSASLGVSRGTLREALRHLQEEGLAVQDQRGRVSVKKVTTEEVAELFEVRLGLESIALRRLCALPDRAAATAELSSRLEALGALDQSLEAGIEADFRFHEALCEAAGNGVLIESWRALSGRIKSTMISAGPRKALENLAVDRHAPIVHFVEAGDIDGGEAYLARHMHDAVANLTDQVNRSRATDGHLPTQATP